jgi:hypothetical protein
MHSDLCGTNRRIQALIRRGFSVVHLSELSGINEHRVRRLAYTPTRVSPNEAERVTAVYEKVELDDPPPGTKRGTIHAHADAGEWIPPEDWAGYDLDDPLTFPPEVEPLTRLDYLAVLRHLWAGDIDQVNQTVRGHQRELPDLVHWLSGRGVPTKISGLIGLEEGGQPERRAGHYLAEYSRRNRRGQAEPPTKALVLFTGSRVLEGHHAPIVWRELASAVRGGSDGGTYVLMEGGAGGGDTVARNVASTMLGWRVLTRPADWTGPCQFDADPRCKEGVSHRVFRIGQPSYCPLSGHRRNQQMVDEAIGFSQAHEDLELHIVGVYHRWYSKGTGDCLKRAKAAGIPRHTKTAEAENGSR